MSHADPHDPVVRARAGVRRARWPALLAGAGGAITVGVLGAAGLAPLLAGVGVGTLVAGPAVEWLTNMGMNALAGWLGNLAVDGLRAPFASDEPDAPPDPAWLAEVGRRLDEAAAADAALAAELARMLAKIDAVPGALEAIAEELGAQSDVILAQYDLLRQLQADVVRLGLAGAALGPVLVAEADRVIAAIVARADRSDAKLDQVLAGLTALRDEQRQTLVSISGQTGDVRIGDVSAGDIHKPVMAPGSIYAPGGTVVQPFTLRRVEAFPEELAESAARLARLPTDAVPEPQDVLPPGSWMGGLSRNQQFVGREEDLLALAGLLKGGRRVAVSQGRSAVASGLGGIGKTQLAVEFAYRYGRHFAGVFWLSFAQPDAVAAEFTRLGGAAHLQLFSEASGLSLDDQVRFVRARLACGLPYLLIFDNCEDPQLVRAHHPGGATRVLITSRNPDWPGDLGVRRHALGVLRREESVALLRQHRPDLGDADTGALAAELGDLPLALHLAGRFLARYGRVLTPGAYLAELRSPRLFERLPLREQDGTLPTGHSRDVARTFALSYERLDPQDAEDDLALKLLARAAHLVPGEVVPADLLRATLEQPHGYLDAQLAAEAALKRLVGLGLLEREDDDGLRMHRLVSAYVRQASDGTMAQRAVERTVIAVAGSLADAPTLATIAEYLPLLRGVTDVALEREDESAAMLCIWLGRSLDRLGAYAPAQPYLERALAIRERVLGAEHPDTATSLNNRANLYLRQGEYRAALPLYQRALAIRERVLGAEHPDTAQSLNNLALLYRAQREYGAALPLYQRALAIRERVLGAEHPDTAQSLNNLAGLYRAQREYGAALPLYQQALAIRERVLGAEHPDTATSLNNLAGLLESQREYGAALPLYQRALAIRERVLGAEHPDTAQSLNNLAGLYRAQREYGAALPLYQQALAIRERVLGAEHPDTAQSLNNLAGLLESQREYGAALPLYQRALAIRERVLGAEHPDTAQSLNNLAGLLESQGEYGAALPLYQQALAIRERVLGAEHPDTAQSLNNLALLYRAQGEYGAALPLYQQALAIRERVLGAEHPDTAQSLNNLAINHYYLSDLPTAEQLMLRALQIREARLGSDHLDTQGSRQSLAVIQQRLGRDSPSVPTNPAEAFTPLLATIAAIAAGDEAQRPAVEQALAQLEGQGWMLRAPVERIWAGERDRESLVTGLDAQDTALVERILTLIAERKQPPRSLSAWFQRLFKR